MSGFRVTVVAALLAVGSAALCVPAAATTGGSAAPAAGARSARPAEATEGRLLLLLDASGSMAEPAAGGGRKIDAARDALTEVVKRLPDDAEVGMRVFGATVESRDDKGACTDTQNVVPVGPVDRARLTEQIAAYEPYGETPIGNALRAAAEDLGPKGRRTIVLMSDGEPTCQPDPCDVAEELRREGVGLRVNVVGLDVDPAARRALQCVAAAGGGSYVDVRDAGELADSMVRVSVRALREFAVQGTPVEGGAEQATATDLTPGQYTDRLARGETHRWYRVEKPAGAGLSASVTTRPAASGETGEQVTVRLVSEQGDPCAEGSASRTNVLAENAVLSAGAAYLPGLLEEEVESCADADALLVDVEYDDATVPRPFELLVEEQPAVLSDLSSLPRPVPDTAAYAREARATGKPDQVIGGVGFDDAPLLQPGVHEDTLRPGEQLFYRVPVDWGQAARVTFTVQPDDRASELLGAVGNTVDAVVFNPYRQAVGNLAYGAEHARDGGPYTGATGLPVTAAIAPVRLRNGSVPWNDLADQAVAGDYVVAVRMGALDGDTEFAAPVRIAVEVDGEADGVPELRAPAAEESAAEAPESKTRAAEPGDTGVPLALLGGAGAVLLLAVASGILLVVRRRRRRA